MLGLLDVIPFQSLDVAIFVVLQLNNCMNSGKIYLTKVIKVLFKLDLNLLITIEDFPST